MRYRNEVEIELPRDRMIELFDNPDNLVKWQRGLESFERISGEPGTVGAKSRLTFNTRGRKMVMVETITRRELPDHFDGIYDIKDVHNIQRNTFLDLPGGRTRWISDTEFEFGGWMRWLAPLMQGMFRKESQRFLDDFKAFAERGVDVRTGGKSA